MQLLYLINVQVLRKQVGAIVFANNFSIVDLFSRMFRLRPQEAGVDMAGLADALASNHAKCSAGISENAALKNYATIAIS